LLSLWLKFKVATGVATALGVFLALCPLLQPSAPVAVPTLRSLWRYVRSFHRGAAANALLIYFLWAPRRAPPIIVTWERWPSRCWSFTKHDANFQRLVEGTEPRFSFSKKKETD